jgi:2-polyprenyl-6-methoxyphenol hydroxylase-like FAD-dependent oxidoreductase
MTTIGITGAGYSGLTLALRLQQLGIDTTVYAGSTPDAMRSARLPNTVGRFGRAVASERSLGVDDDPGPDRTITGIQFRAGPPVDLAYEGRFTTAPRATDFRLLLPELVERYSAGGGRLVITPDIDAAEVERRAADHELMVVAVGRRSVSALFPVDPARSPYTTPQRLVVAGLFHGLAAPDPLAVSLNVSPGAGEIVQMPLRTAAGPASSILLDAVPGGPLAELASRPADDDGFAAALLDALRRHAPAVAGRVDPAAFALTGPTDWLQGAIVPTVRHASCRTTSGTTVVAIGDAWITNDPITAQGANLGSRCAWVAAEHIAGGGPYDEAFGRRLEAAMWEQAAPATAFTNAFLQPPPPHVGRLLVAAAGSRAVADRYVDLFDDPAAMWATVASPEGVEAFIASCAEHPVALVGGP